MNDASVSTWPRTVPGSADVELLPEVARASVTGSWSLDLRAGTLRWSDEMHAIYGTDPHSYSPTPAGALTMMHPDDVPAAEAMMSTIRETGRPFAFRHRLVHASGGIRLLEVRGWVEHGTDGEPSAALGTASDITMASVAERERELISRQQALILRATGDGVCGIDADGRVTFCNRALSELTGRPIDELTGAALHRLVHRDANGRDLHPEAECPYADRRQARITAVDVDFRRSDGSPVEVSYTLVSVTDERFPGAVISFTDMTAVRHSESLLQASLGRVESLSAERGRLLRDLAQAEERERERIAADIHDDTIQALSAVDLRLERAGLEIPDPQVKETLAQARLDVRGAATRLRQMMFELLPPVPEGRLRTAIETYCSLLFDDMSLRYEVIGDPDELPAETHVLAYRLAQEALRNARKHSEGTLVRAELELRAGELVVCISDDGVGFGVTSPHRPTHGGLRILRQRATAAGGSATAGSGIDGRGSSILIRLPLRRSSGSAG